MKRTTIDQFMHSTLTKNKYGEWVTAIPEPYYILGMKVCHCGYIYFTRRGYDGHYALEHVMYYK